MIAAMVGAIVLIVLVLVIVWLVSPAFRAWSENPKHRMLERDAMFEAPPIGSRSPPANIVKADGMDEMKRKTQENSDENRF